MILKIFGVLQLIFVQIVSAQISARDLSRQNVWNKLANKPLLEYGRSTRQINNPPVDLQGNRPRTGMSNSLPLRDGTPFGKFPHSNGLPSNFALNNGLPNNSPIPSMDFPFSNMNVMPQNRLLPNINGNNNDGIPNFNNVPNGLPGLNNVPNGLPGLHNIPNGLPGLNNVPNGLPGLNNVSNGLPGLNNVPNGLPGLNNVPNGLPGLSNFPNRLPCLNNVPNGLPGLNNVPNGLPGLNNVPNGLSGLNNVLNGLPGLNNVPSGLPGLNNVPGGLPGLNYVPNGFPGFNTVPNGPPMFNNLPVTNTFQNLINVPTGSNILNLNNLPAANPLPNINNVPNPNGKPNFNNLPPNNLPSSDILPPFHNRTPFLNNFRTAEIGIGNGNADNKRLPRDYQLDGNIFTVNTNNFQNVNGLTQQVHDELLPNRSINRFSGISNTPLVREMSNNAPAMNRLSSVNNFPEGNGLNYFAGETQTINAMELNNGMPDTTNFQNYVIPASEQRFVNNIPFDNGYAFANQFPANTGMPNTNTRLVNAINNDMLHNAGQLNDIWFVSNEMSVSRPETHLQNIDGNEFLSNGFQFGFAQVPDNNWHYDFVGANVPTSQNLLPEGVQRFSNVPSDYQIGLTSNHLGLAQDLAKHLQMEGLANIPFLNGLPVAGITETVTVLNAPYSK